MPTKTFSELITFTRASTATYYDAEGVLQTAAIDEPRLTYDPETGEALGLLIEEERTRLNTIAAAPTDPENVTVTAVAHTISFFGTGTVNLTGVATETLVGTGASDRVTLTFTPTAGTLTITPIGMVENLQIEAGSFATSVILGEGSQAVRGLDNASVDDLSGWFNSLAHTVYGTFIPDYLPVGQVAIFSFGEGTSSNDRVSVSIDGGNLRIVARGGGGAVTGETYMTLTLTEGQKNKVAFSFDGSELIASVNGVSESSPINTYPNTLDNLALGRFNNISGQEYTGKIPYFKAEPRALSATQLEALTAP